MYSIKDVGALSPIPAEGNSSGEPEEWQGKVQMRYNLLFTQVVKMQVPCNPNLKAGDVVKCFIETITPDSKQTIAADPVESGNYLILDLCHHYDPQRSFTSMTLVRDTYGLYTNKKLDMANNLGYDISNNKWFLGQVPDGQNHFTRDSTWTDAHGDRVKVRIPGMHPMSSSEDATEVPNELLPWDCGKTNYSWKL